MKKKVKVNKEVKKPKKKMHLKQWVWLVIGVIFAISFAIGGFQYFSWSRDNRKIDTIVNELEEITEVEEIPENEEEIVNPPEESTNGGGGGTPNNDYYNYIKLPLISVDFTDLKAKNSDTVAFIKVAGTNINYPVVQTDNNDYYLNHSFDKKTNSAGWVFSDYRNNLNNLKDNTVIYGHGRVNKTMFGSLKNVFENNWLKNSDNFVIHLATPEQSYLFQVISVYKIPTETYYITTNFGTRAGFQEFLDTIIKRSQYNFNVSVNTNDKILTLSTCYNKTDKVVLHAKLIKKQA